MRTPRLRRQALKVVLGRCRRAAASSGQPASGGRAQNEKIRGFSSGPKPQRTREVVLGGGLQVFPPAQVHAAGHALPDAAAALARRPPKPRLRRSGLRSISCSEADT